MEIYSILNHYFNILKPTDIFEILFFSFCFYKFISWLSKDNSKNLPFLFFGYCSLFLATGFLEAETLHNFLFTYSPVFLTLFIVLSQTVIQKNFVFSKKIKPAKSEDTTWVMELLKSVVISMSKNRDLIVVIECKDDISKYINLGIKFDSLISKNLLNLVFGSLNFENQQIVYLTSDGVFRAINSKFNFSSNSNLDDQISILTDKSDALVLRSSSSLRTMEIILQNKCLKDLNIEKACDVILHYLKSLKVSKFKPSSSFNNLDIVKKDNIKGAQVSK